MPRPVIPVTRSRNPFPRKDLDRGPDGLLRFGDVPATLVDMLRAHADTRPDTEAVVELGGLRLTYAQLWERAARVAGGLRAQGVAQGDRVAVRYPAGTDWALAFWGTVMAGGIAVAVNTRSAQPEVEFVLGDAGVKVDLAAGTPLPDGHPYVAANLEPSDVAALFYTSGTTGRPKGVPTTHEAFVTNAENLVRCLGIPRDVGPELRTLVSVPLFHVTACNSQFMVAAYLGGTSVIMPALHLPQLTTALAAERISFVVTVPAVYSLLLRHPSFADAEVSGVRWLAYGGAPIAPSLVRSLKEAFPGATVINGYGMTETASLITVLPDQDAADHADSVGYAVPSVDLGIVPIGDDPSTGELVVRGVTVTNGYWRRPEATAETMTNGWLHTGDIVRVDDAGRVHIVDRVKDIINRGGENISSVEVEAVLLSAPGVADAAVLAVPDDVMGEKVGAVLFAEQGEIDIASVVAHCRQRLADFKVPQYAAVVTQALPRNAGGKLLKNELRLQVRWGAPLR
ncbi:class I adenylate-forming enzyme family protein [Streptomyces sp. NPDC015661]|uniref:class I adenylate-forming enzyme family protein n=1 Tax=Streptomyces sp. NPDC015661 TaxID=3364961 RepID=UPI0037002DBC